MPVTGSLEIHRGLDVAVVDHTICLFGLMCAGVLPKRNQWHVSNGVLTLGGRLARCFFPLY